MYRAITVLIFITGILSLILPAPVTIQAQDNFTCPDGLSSTDCDILQQSETTIADLESIMTDFNIEFVFRTESDPLEFITQGSGPIRVTDGMPVAADFTLDESSVEFPPEDISQSGSGLVRILDGMIYTADSADGPWEGGTLRGVEDGTMLPAGDTNIIAMLFSDLTVDNEYLVWSRANDTEIDGEPVAVFSASLDFVALARSPEIYEMLTESIAGSGGDIDPATASVAIDFVIEQIASQLENSELVATRYVSLNDYNIHRVELDLLFDLNLSMFGAEIEQSGFPVLLLFDLSFQANLSGHNEDYAITAPENWQDTGSVDISRLFGEALEIVIESNMGTQETVSGSDSSLIISYGEEVTGTLTSIDQADIYLLEASAGDTIRVTLRTAETNSDLDTWVKIYDEDGNQLAENDDADNREGGLGIFDSRINRYTIEEDGVYLIEADAVYLNQDGDYRLLVEILE